MKTPLIIRKTFQLSKWYILILTANHKNLTKLNKKLKHNKYMMTNKRNVMIFRNNLNHQRKRKKLKRKSPKKNLLFLFLLLQFLMKKKKKQTINILIWRKIIKWILSLRLSQVKYKETSTWKEMAYIEITGKKQDLKVIILNGINKNDYILIIYISKIN